MKTPGDKPMSTHDALANLTRALDMLADPARPNREARVRATIQLMLIQDYLLAMIDAERDEPERLAANLER